MTFLASPIFKIISFLVLAALVSWSVDQLLKHQQQLGYEQRTQEYRVEENKALQAALAETYRLNSLIQKANDEAKKREEANRVLSVRNNTLLGKLRNADTRINELVSSASLEASRNAVRAYAGLFAECRDDFEAMGRAAAGHYSDVKTLEASWPEQSKP